MVRNDNDVSLLTWGPLPPAAADSSKHHFNRYVLLRQQFSSAESFLEVPTPHHKILCGGVVVHGRTVVLSSYPDDGTTHINGASSATAGHLQRWVVHHRPLTAAAKVEAMVVAVYDPDNLLDVRINSTTWGHVRRSAKAAAAAKHEASGAQQAEVVQSLLYRWDLEENHRAAGRRSSTQQLTSLLVAQVNCAKLDDHDGRGTANTTINPWMLVGGGFHSEHPVVSCGPEWRRVWRVAAPPHDALTAFSISIRMSPTFMTSTAHLGAQRIAHARHSIDDDDDDGEGSIRFDTVVPSRALSGASSPLNSFGPRHPQQPHQPQPGGELDFGAVAVLIESQQQLLRSSSETGSIDFEEHTDDTTSGRSRHIATPSVRSPRLRSSSSTPHSSRRGAPQLLPQHATSVIRVTLGDTTKGPANGVASSHGEGAAARLGGEWSVTLPEPFGMMCALFRGCHRQDNVALHAICTRSAALQQLHQQTSTDRPAASNTPRHTTATNHRVGGASPLAAMTSQSNVATAIDSTTGVKRRTRALWQK